MRGFGCVICFPFSSEDVANHEIELIGPDLPVVVGVVRVEAQTYSASVAVAAWSGTVFDEHPRLLVNLGGSP